jgi:tellurite resistance protein TerB
MLGLGKLFGKKTGEAKAQLNKLQNKDLMEATIGAALLVSAADGKIEDEELLKLQEIIEALPTMSHFGSEIGQTIDRLSKLLKAGFVMGKVQIMREIADCKHSEQEAEDVLVTAITIASADGEVEPQEAEIIKEVAKKLGLNPANYGL